MCICVCVYVYMYVCVYVCMCMCTCIYVHIYIYTYTYAHTHICTYTHMHIYTYILILVAYVKIEGRLTFVHLQQNEHNATTFLFFSQDFFFFRISQVFGSRWMESVSYKPCIYSSLSFTQVPAGVVMW